MQDVGLRTPLESGDTPAPKSDGSQAPSSQIHSESRNIKFPIRHGILIPGPKSWGEKRRANYSDWLIHSVMTLVALVAKLRDETMHRCP